MDYLYKDGGLLYKDGVQTGQWTTSTCTKYGAQSMVLMNAPTQIAGLGYFMRLAGLSPLLLLLEAPSPRDQPTSAGRRALLGAGAAFCIARAAAASDTRELPPAPPEAPPPSAERAPIKLATPEEARELEELASRLPPIDAPVGSDLDKMLNSSPKGAPDDPRAHGA